MKRLLFVAVTVPATCAGLLLLLGGVPVGGAGPGAMLAHVRGLELSLLLLVAACGAALAVLIVVVASPGTAGPAHGSARWATRRDIATAGLAGRRGIILGATRRSGRLLRADGPTHVLLSAPTRSGKGAGFVIPNLLDWPGSVVALDIKGENYRYTAGLRAAHGHDVYRFDPGSPDTDRWNPLALPSGDPDSRVRELQQLAASLYPAAGGREEFWVNQARELFVGAALLVIEGRGPDASMGEVYRLLMHPELAGFVAGELTSSAGLSPDCRERLDAWAKCDAAATRAGVLASARERLLPWGERGLDAATAAGDFALDVFRHRRSALYVAVAPQDLGRLQHVLRLFFEQLLLANIRAAAGADSGSLVPLLLMLDEFPVFGRVASFEQGIAYVASYGIRICLIAQSEAQLRAVYGQEGARILIDNCANRIFFTPNAPEEASGISRLLGTRTVGARTRSGGIGFATSRGSSVSVSEVGRPLLDPSEVRQIGDDAAIVMTAGCPPILAKKLRWFRRRSFRRRVSPPPAARRQPRNSP